MYIYICVYVVFSARLSQSALRARVSPGLAETAVPCAVRPSIELCHSALVPTSVYGRCSFGVLFSSCACVCVVVGGVVLCRCVCVTC